MTRSTAKSGNDTRAPGVCYKWDNVWFGVDAWMPKYLKPEIINRELFKI